MVTIEFLGPINKKAIEVDIQNLNELSDILKQDEDLKDWLNNSAVAINDTLVKDKNQTLTDGDKISLLPPVCGG